MTKEAPQQALPTMALDGYENIFNGVGTAADPTTGTVYRPDALLQPELLEAIFRSDGLGRRLVEMPAEDMVREWLELEGELRSSDADAEEGTKFAAEETLDILEEINAQQRCIEAVMWARLFGDSVALLVIDDGGDHSTPVNERNINRVVGMKIYDRTCVTMDANSRSRDELKGLEGFPEFYQISPPSGGSQFTVHESRIVLIPGQRTTDRVRQLNGGWNDSVLQGCWTALQRHGMSLGYGANILKDFVQAVLSIKGLTELIAGGREEAVKKRLRLLDVSRSVLGTVVMDADGEQFTKHASSISGVPELLDRFSESLSSATGIPMTVLFGRSPAGQNSTGESDTRIYYDLLAREQKRQLTPLLETLIRYIFLSKEGPTGGVEPEAWSLKWRDLNQLTDLEEAELKKKYADMDKIYLDAAVVSPDEVMKSRFGSGSWSPNMVIDQSLERDTDLLPPDPVEQAGAVAEAEARAGALASANEDTAPRTLYVSRKLINVADVKRWAATQGIEINIDDLHVTVCYSKAEVDWMKARESWDQLDSGQIVVKPGGPRQLELFGPQGGILVLAFASNQLGWRHQEFRDVGASWDFDEYQPHISLRKMDSGEGVNLKPLTPYQGKLVFGPEIFEEVKED